MIRSIFRSAGSIVLSLVTALVLIVAVEGVSAILHPFPPGVDASDYEVCKAHVARYPAWVLALAAAAWGLTTFVSTYVATRLGSGRHPAHGIAIGSLLLLAVAFNMSRLPYPLWFKIANGLFFPLSIFWGTKLGRGGPSNRRRAEANLNATPDSSSV